MPEIPGTVVQHRTLKPLHSCLLLTMWTISASATIAQEPAVVDFENDLQPIFTRFGCNSGPCHGKARGQGGFQLSLLGFDAQQDYDAITKEGRGRRIFPGAPESSLLLAKPAGAIPHGGGRRLDVTGPEYQTMLNWVRQGMPRKAPDAATLQSITVSPSSSNREVARECDVVWVTIRSEDWPMAARQLKDLGRDSERVLISTALTV